jgi:ankyrin repeat protein
VVKSVEEQGTAYDKYTRGMRQMRVSCMMHVQRGDEHVEMLIDSRADLNAADRDARTPLHRACDVGHGSVVRMPIDSGAALNVTDGKELPPLHRACDAGHEFVVSMLIDGGAQINVTGRYWWTLLHRACHEGQGSIVSILINGGATVNVIDNHGRTPLHAVCSKVNTRTRQGHEQSPDPEIIRVFILNGADTQRRDRQGLMSVGLL